MRRGALVRCPPRSETQAVEDLTPPKYMSYGWDNGPRQVLGSQAVFAVVRWTNLWFPVEKGFFGDWFGGPLQPRFGPGIRDVPVTGNRPGRLCPALAHSYYFRYPDANEKNDIAREIRDALALNMYADLCELRTAPAPDPRTVGTLRRAQLSMMATVNDRRPGSVGAPT